MKELSRQRKWQIKMRAEGRCVKCSQPKSPYNKNYCELCAEKIRLSHPVKIRRNGPRGSHETVRMLAKRKRIEKYKNRIETTEKLLLELREKYKRIT